MAIYADYNYYTATFGGKAIPEGNFLACARWTSALLDRLTFGRLKKFDAVPDAVKDAVCAASEKYYSSQQRTASGVKSESNDGYSVSYDDALSDTQREASLAGIIRNMLAGTEYASLLYRGRNHFTECEGGGRG